MKQINLKFYCLILNAFNIREKVKSREETTTINTPPMSADGNAAKVAGKKSAKTQTIQPSQGANRLLGNRKNNSQPTQWVRVE